MNQEFKIQCYQESYQELKSIPQVKNLQYPEEKKNLDFSCDIENIHVEYSMRLGVDFVKIRGEKPYPGLTDSQITEIGQNLVKGTSVKFTAYSETLIFQLSLPLVGIADEDAKAFAIKESSDFFHFLLKVEGITEIPEPVMEKEEDTPSKCEDKGKLSNEKILTEKSIQKELPSSSHAGVTLIPYKNTERIGKNTNYKSSSSKDALNLEKKQIEQQNETVEVQNDTNLVNKQIVNRSRELTEARRNELEYLIAMRTENNRREAELKKLQEEFANREQNLLEKESALHDTLLQLEKEKKTLANELDQIEMIKKAAQDDTNQALIMLEQEEAKTIELTNKVNDLQVQYNKTQNEVEKLKQNNAKLRESIAEKESKIGELNKYIEQQEQLLKEDINWNKRLQEEKRLLEQKLADKELEIESVKQEVVSLREKSDKEVEHAVLSVKESWQNTLDENKISFQNIIKENEESYQKEIQSIYSKHKKELESLNATHKNQLEELEQSLKAKDAISETAYKQKIDEYNALNEKYEQVFSDKQMLNEELKKLKLEYATLSKVKTDGNNRLLELENEIASKCETINDLESRLQQYRNGGSLGTPDEILEDFAETRKENRRLQREIEDLKEEGSSNISSLKKEIENLNHIISQKDEEAKKLSEMNTVEYKISQIIAETASMGVMMNSTDNKTIIGKRDGCEITIYPDKDMLLCKVHVARAAKYANDICKWNEEDVTEMYYFTKREVICKKKFDNISIDLQKIIRKFVLLK